MDVPDNYMELLEELWPLLHDEMFSDENIKETLRKGFKEERDNPSLVPDFQETLDPYIGLFCLTETPSNKLMWSHYAVGHRGIVIGLKADHSFFLNEEATDERFRRPQKVQYVSEQPAYPGLSDSPEEDMQDWMIDNLIFKKDASWKYEEEWRHVHYLGNADEILNEDQEYPICLFSFPADLVESVILGAKVEPEYSEKVSELLSKNEYTHTSLKEAQLKDFSVQIPD